MYRKKAHIHFVGIGGIGMSGIAHILRQQGYTISGCDADIAQKSIHELQHLGCSIFEGNNTPACADPSIDIVVYSSAIQAVNPEIKAAQQRGIPTIRRALMLAELMRTKYSIAIAGSHGKTTTTSMVSHILIETGMDPTVIIGGHLINMSSNARMGSGDFLVAEADESDRSFLHLQATLALVTNIDFEHVETYKDLDDVKETYTRFLNNLPFYGKAFICIDDQHVQEMLPLPHIKLIKYGISADAELTAHNIRLLADRATFDVYWQNEKLGPITLLMPGTHNVLNCLGAIAIALDVGISFAAIADALAHFKGVERRFWYRGTYNGAEVFDDYAHHPKEIDVALQVAKQRAKKKLRVIFQPHRYTRTHRLWHDFIDVLTAHDIDELVITDIYPASEAPIEGITTPAFVAALQAKKPSLVVRYVPYDSAFAALKKDTASHAKTDDLLLLLGAGRLTYLATSLCDTTP